MPRASPCGRAGCGENSFRSRRGRAERSWQGWRLLWRRRAVGGQTMVRMCAWMFSPTLRRTFRRNADARGQRRAEVALGSGRMRGAGGRDSHKGGEASTVLCSLLGSSARASAPRSGEGIVPTSYSLVLVRCEQTSFLHVRVLTCTCTSKSRSVGLSLHEPRAPYLWRIRPLDPLPSRAHTVHT